MTLPLLPHQETGSDFLIAKSRAGLFDEMGVGKSATAIGGIDKARLRRGIIVCPAAVREVWRGESKKFARLPRRILKATSIDDLNLWLRGKADVLIVSYEMAAKWASKIEGDLFDFLILDEAHYLKSSTAQRTRALLGTHCDGKSGLARWAAHTWFLTGTPMPNDPTDIWTWLRFCGGTNLTLTAFTARYFRSKAGTYSSRQEPRAEMAPELRSQIRKHSIRRTAEDVGLQLPPIWLTTTTIDGDTREIAALLREHPGLDAAIMEAIEKGGLSFLDAQHIATLRRLVGVAKAPAAAALFAEEFSSGVDKQVIFGIHTEPLKLIHAELNSRGFKAVMLMGETPEAQRMEAVRSFQEDPSVRAFVGNLKAAGTGNTLTAAADLTLFESAWAPADNAQAIKRIHRISQLRTCRARFLSLANSIDEVVTDVVARKTAAIAVIEGREAA